MTCNTCGRVALERVVDPRAEWASSAGDRSGDPDPNRVGRRLAGSDLNQELALSIRAAPGAPKVRGQLTALERALQAQGSSTETATTRAACQEIDKMCYGLKLTEETRKRAKDFYRRVHETGELKSMHHSAVATACLLIASSNEEGSRTFKEVMQVATTKDQRKVKRCFKRAKAALQLYATPKASADADIARFAHRIEPPLSFGQIKIMRTAVLREAEIGVLDGRKRDSKAAGIMLLAAHCFGGDNSAKEPANVRNATGVAEATQISVYRDLHPIRNYLFAGMPEMDIAAIGLAPSRGPPETKFDPCAMAARWAATAGITVPDLRGREI